MIIDKYAQVKIGSANYNKYEKLGYNVKMKEIISININDLSNGSHAKINCKCDYCDNETNISYKNYVLQINKNNIYACNKCAYKKAIETNLKTIGVEFNSQTQKYKDKYKETCLKKYGMNHYSKTQEYKDKYKETCLKKYGHENIFQSIDIINKIKEINIISGKWAKKNEEYALYRRKVIYQTSKNKENLLKNWNGYDYYDNEFILNNFKLNNNNKNYPTIDHIIPIIFGYINNIDIIKMSDISNLCITKKSINSSKGNKINFKYVN